MEIRPISPQSRSTLREMYDPARYKEYQEQEEYYVTVSRKMLAFLDHLEAIEHPPVWAYISMMALVFIEEGDYRQRLVSVQAHCASRLQPYYCIAYAMPEPWDSTRAYTKDPSEAATLMVEGYRRAHRGKERWASVDSGVFPPLRGMPADNTGAF